MSATQAGRALAHLIEYRRIETHLSIGARLDLIDTINELHAQHDAELDEREAARLDFEAGQTVLDPLFDYAPTAEEEEWMHRYLQTSRASG